MSNFVYTEWGGEKPPEVKRISGDRVIVARNVRAMTRDGETTWVGESAIMSAVAYGAYLGAMEAERKREQDVVDETVLKLIEEGSL